ncbi:Arc family DNA-binding protein [Rhizobium sp. CFBP 8762]|uniref:Arc family DNA-binding protein n=1 Tax=Rhizobium sp. CFBP 8762 TaxID=2775279 RepID=UPI00177FB071|nr:Arc family DNA-binding protein [Rhizobium sp. CFBP 8762]MBD8555526.1 Arc family DNA-binding protein [Rhizobium sp. CFBP 8762]
MAREDPQLKLRLTEEMKLTVTESARQNNRSVNAEIVQRLEQSFRGLPELPEDLMDRISVYAQRQGRTAGEEILRLLEREYPKQWDIDDRMEHMANLLAALASGKSDGRINQFVIDMQDTVQGIVSGRVTGVDSEIRDEVASLWFSYQNRLSEIQFKEQEDQYELDEEEQKMQTRTGKTEKFAVPRPQDADSYEDAHFLARVLPSRSLEGIAESIRSGDLEAAAKIIRNMPQDKLRDRVRFEQLPEEAQYRLRGEEPPQPKGSDPFSFTE